MGNGQAEPPLSATVGGRGLQSAAGCLQGGGLPGQRLSQDPGLGSRQGGPSILPSEPGLQRR